MHPRIASIVIFVLANALPLTAQHVSGTAEVALAIDDYKNVEVLIGELKQNSAGLTEDVVRTRTELRLRTSGLKPVAPSTVNRPYLYVSVHVVGNAFNITIEFMRSASWVLPNQKGGVGYAATWYDIVLGTHGGSSTYIVDALDELLDKFMNAYLKANQK